MEFHGFIVMALRKCFRNWKNKLHDHYCKYATDEERLSNQPDGVDPEDWKWLVLEHFVSNDFKVSYYLLGHLIIIIYYNNENLKFK